MCSEGEVMRSAMLGDVLHDLALAPAVDQLQPLWWPQVEVILKVDFADVDRRRRPPKESLAFVVVVRISSFLGKRRGRSRRGRRSTTMSTLSTFSLDLPFLYSASGATALNVAGTTSLMRLLGHI